MKLHLRVWAIRPDTDAVFLRATDGTTSILTDTATLSSMVMPADVEEGDEVTLSVVLSKRTRPERQA